MTTDRQTIELMGDVVAAKMETVRAEMQTLGTKIDAVDEKVGALPCPVHAKQLAGAVEELSSINIRIMELSTTMRPFRAVVVGVVVIVLGALALTGMKIIARDGGVPNVQQTAPTTANVGGATAPSTPIRSGVSRP